jgi:hypothetical protein
MSTDLLLNFDKNTSTSTVSNEKSLKSNNSLKRSEGSSLFDSLMNQAKKGSSVENNEMADKPLENNTNTDKTLIKKSESNDKPTIKNESTIIETLNKELNKSNSTDKDNSEVTNKLKTIITKEASKDSPLEIKTTQEETSDPILNKEKNKEKIIPVKLQTENIKNDNIDTSSKKESKYILNKAIESPKIINNEVPEESVQKLVDKLVDIVVSAAKDVLHNKKDKSINTNELTTTVEKIVENKIADILEKGNLESVISKKLDIVSNSIKIITNETEVISKNNVITNKEELVIDEEVSLIKDSVKILKKELVKNEDIEILEIKTKDPINPEYKTKITNEIDNSLSIIDENSSDIKDLLNKEMINDKKNVSVVSLKNKIEFKTETIAEAVVTIKEKVSEIVIVSTLKKENLESLSKMVENTENLDDSLKKPLLAAMFLTAQKVSKDKTSLEQIKDAKNNIIENRSVDAVKVSSEKLDLNMKDTKVSHEEQEGKKPTDESKIVKLNTNTLINNKSLNQVFINQKIEAESIVKQENKIIPTDLNQIKNNQERKNTELVEIVVPKEIIPSFQSKIIGAQQKMGTFMNDVARNMYLNYKPPVTAFRVNLNPANLGSISIIMKANKIDNSLNVSMNLSNSNTLEAFSENKVALQSAIQRQFTDSSNVSINFSMDNTGSENEFNQDSNHNNDKKNENNKNTELESESIEEQEIIENNDYM